MDNRERFLSICKEEIKREGIENLLDFICSPASDFFTAPASTRFHSSFEGGLLLHSLNVYDCLVDYIERARVRDIFGMEYSRETLALTALFHDLCKVNTYKVGTRNVKDEKGEDKLYTLKEKGLGAIYLGSQETDYTLRSSETGEVNGRVRRNGLFLYESGMAGTIAHVDMTKGISESA